MKCVDHRGFTLIEILVTMAILGIVTMAIYSLYLTTQRTATTQDEVVELQQNLRIAMDQMVRDIRMAGFVVAFSDPPIENAPNAPVEGDAFIMNTASPSGRAARIDSDKSIAAGDTEATFTLGSSDMVDLFYADAANGDLVRILRPPSQEQPYAALFRVISKDRTARTVTLEGFGASPGIQYKAGDGLVVSSGTHPGTITFYLKDFEIFKEINGGAAQRITAKRQVGGNLVNGVTSLECEYLMENGSTLSTVTGTDRWNVRAVRVTVIGEANVQGDVKTRSLTNVVTLRNR